MAKAPSGEFDTVRVHRAWVAANIERGAALVLDTVESGPIAFELTLEVIEGLRQHLQEAETFLRQQSGSA